MVVPSSELYDFHWQTQTSFTESFILLVLIDRSPLTSISTPSQVNKILSLIFVEILTFVHTIDVYRLCIAHHSSVKPRHNHTDSDIRFLSPHDNPEIGLVVTSYLRPTIPNRGFPYSFYRSVVSTIPWKSVFSFQKWQSHLIVLQLFTFFKNEQAVIV